LPDFETEEDFHRFLLSHVNSGVQIYNKYGQWCVRTYNPPSESYDGRVVPKLNIACYIQRKGHEAQDEAKAGVTEGIKCCQMHWDMLVKGEGEHNRVGSNMGV
jgi:hypothetical protein